MLSSARSQMWRSPFIINVAKDWEKIPVGEDTLDGQEHLYLMQRNVLAWICMAKRSHVCFQEKRGIFEWIFGSGDPKSVALKTSSRLNCWHRSSSRAKLDFVEWRHFSWADMRWWEKGRMGKREEGSSSCDCWRDQYDVDRNDLFTLTETLMFSSFLSAFDFRLVSDISSMFHKRSSCLAFLLL